MLQLNPTLPMQTPLGDGEAFLVIDYGPDVNTCYVVRLEGGIVKHVWSDDVRLYGNPMNGAGWDVAPFPAPAREEDRESEAARMLDEQPAESTPLDLLKELQARMKTGEWRNAGLHVLRAPDMRDAIPMGGGLYAMPLDVRPAIAEGNMITYTNPDGTTETVTLGGKSIPRETSAEDRPA